MKNHRLAFGLLFVLAPGSLFIDCAAARNTNPVLIPVSTLKTDFAAFAPPAVAVSLEASATLEVTAVMTPDVRQFWRTGYCGDETVDNYLNAVREVLTERIANSGLFAHIIPAGGHRPNVIVKVQYEESDIKDLKVRLTLQAIDPTSGKELSSHSGSAGLGIIGQRSSPRAFSFGTTDQRPLGNYGGLSIVTHRTVPILQAMLPRLEQALASAVQRHLLQPEREKAAAALRTAALPDLLVANDLTVELARARNRALVAAKIQQLPELLRNDRTDALIGLQLRIEQLMLDLDHECVVNNDRAQRVLGANGNLQQVDALRGLAICYRERIELLKPIAAALKEEIANRNR